MSTQLHIGEVAKLLGVTQKTIRHYHKVGLLKEPPRSEGGYRLYTASDLLRLQRIRRLQALGLSLKQIKNLLGEHVSEHEHTLREVLQSLLEELSTEIQTLEAQRERVKTLLAQDPIEQPADTSPTIEFVKEHLGEQFIGVSESLLELDTKIFSQVDAFNWPASYQESLKTMIQYVAEHPAQYQQMLSLSERLAALADLPEDAPEVDQLIKDVVESDDMFTFMATLSELETQLPAMPGIFSDMLAEIANATLSPAQHRFLEALNRKQSNFKKREML